MADKFSVKEPSTLLIFLLAHLKGWSRNTVKQRLASACVLVNGKSATKHNQELKQGDSVEVLASPIKSKPKPKQLKSLEVLYSDSELIVINKPAGLLSVSTSRDNKNTALSLLRNQVSTTKKHMQLCPVHRLDRDTSGVLLFATSRTIREEIASVWTKAKKTYLAIVDGIPNPPEGTIDQPLRLDEERYFVHVGAHPQAKSAVTHYTTEKTTSNRSLLRVQIETGRQHQIRAHLSWLGYPIVGDQRYGTAGIRLGLHALKLNITHPRTKIRLTFEAKADADFYALLK